MKSVFFSCLLWLGLTLVAVPGTVLAATELERRFTWEEAAFRAFTANTPEDFLNAAQAYRKLADSGVRNGPLFYNLGTTLLKAGRHDAAYESLLRAERYSGSDPDIRQNLLLATARGKTERDVYLPWYRTPLFWHYAVPVSTRITAAAIAFLSCWLAMTARLLGMRFWTGRWLGLSLVILVLFGSSALTTLHQEAGADRTSSFSLTASPGVPERKPAESSPYK